MSTHKPVMIDELYGELKPYNPPCRWSVLHTKPQSEKKLAEYLRRNAIPYYLPQYDSIRVYAHRKVTFTKPMFPGYLFSSFAPSQKTTVLVCGYIVNILKVTDEHKLLCELNSIYLGRQHKSEFAITQWLESGWEVEIVSGPLQGMLGVVKDHKKLDEVTLLVEVLHQAVTMRVNPADVRVLSYYNYE